MVQCKNPSPTEKTGKFLDLEKQNHPKTWNQPNVVIKPIIPFWCLNGPYLSCILFLMGLLLTWSAHTLAHIL